MSRKILGTTGWALAGAIGGLVCGSFSNPLFHAWEGAPPALRHGLEGAALGFVLLPILRALWRSRPTELRITKVTAKLPEIAEFELEVSSPARALAWHLLIELATRIATQPLDRDGGDVSVALASLYRVFDETRNELKTVPFSEDVSGRNSVEYVALVILNKHLRPFLSRWHPSVDRWKAAQTPGSATEFPDATELRRELEELRGHLCADAKALGKLVGLKDEDVAVLLGEPKGSQRVVRAHRATHAPSGRTPVR